MSSTGDVSVYSRACEHSVVRVLGPTCGPSWDPDFRRQLPLRKQVNAQSRLPVFEAALGLVFRAQSWGRGSRVQNPCPFKPLLKGCALSPGSLSTPRQLGRALCVIGLAKPPQSWDNPEIVNLRTGRAETSVRWKRMCRMMPLNINTVTRYDVHVRAQLQKQWKRMHSSTCWSPSSAMGTDMPNDGRDCDNHESM